MGGVSQPSPAEPLAEAFRYWSRPDVIRYVRFPPADDRRAQLESVGWLCLYLGAPDLGLRLLAVARPARHVLTWLTRTAIEGLMSGDTAPARRLDDVLTARNPRPQPPWDLGPESVVRGFENLASIPSPVDALRTSAVLKRAVSGAWADAVGIPVTHVRELGERQLAEAAAPRLRSSRVDPDGDGLTIGAVVHSFRWLPSDPASRWRLRSWTYGDHHGYPLVEVARSWGWVMRTSNGLRGDLGHGITRLRPIWLAYGYLDRHGYHPDWVGADRTALGDSAVIGDGPGLLLVLPRFVTPAGPPFVPDCAAWVLDIASGQVVHRAPSLWRFLRDR